MTLKDLKVGGKGKIVKIEAGEKALRRRIMEMGLTKNTVLQVIKSAPLGDPIEISVRGYELTLRKADAELVTIVEVKK
jgi:Fe2+ transport system protein A